MGKKYLKNMDMDAMNRILCQIVKKTEEEGIIFLNLDFCGEKLGVMSVGGDFKLSQNVWAEFKESDVMISLSPNISARNKFFSKVKTISHNSILSRVVFDFHNQEIFSLISYEAVRDLKIKEGEFYYWFVKSSGIVLFEE